mgnify:FL=1
MNFAKGYEGEDLWKQHLESKGVKAEFSSRKGNKPVYWDVKDTSSGVKYEVKLDEKAMYWARKQSRPPNLYIEYWSTTRDEKCGIYSLEADYLIYIVKDLEGRTVTYDGYCFKVPQLIDHLEASDYKTKGNSMYGDDNAKGWVPPINSLIENKSSGFVKCVSL